MLCVFYMCSEFVCCVCSICVVSLYVVLCVYYTCSEFVRVYICIGVHSYLHFSSIFHRIPCIAVRLCFFTLFSTLLSFFFFPPVVVLLCVVTYLSRGRVCRPSTNLHFCFLGSIKM